MIGRRAAGGHESRARGQTGAGGAGRAVSRTAAVADGCADGAVRALDARTADTTVTLDTGIADTTFTLNTGTADTLFTLNTSTAGIAFTL